METTTTKPITQILHNMSIAGSAQPTKEQPICIEDWAKWLRFQTNQDPQLEEVVRKCAQWARRFKTWSKPATSLTPSWISLLGKTGTGKTHCATRLWDWASNNFRWAPFEFIHMPIYWPAMIRDLRSGERYNELRELSSWPVLMLDDIGAERDTTGFATEQLNTLLGCRVGKWTIITSNLSLEQLGAIDPRIPDRIIREPGNEFIEVDTVSYGVSKLKLESQL